MPSGTAVPTPTLAGLAKVSSGLDIASLLTPTWGTGQLPPLEAGQVEGAFRFLCAPSHNAYDDPIVFPGQPGKSHLHTFFGNTLADGNSTYESLRKTGDSTCNDMLNRSAYWIPALMLEGRLLSQHRTGREELSGRRTAGRGHNRPGLLERDRTGQPRPPLAHGLHVL